MLSDKERLAFIIYREMLISLERKPTLREFANAVGYKSLNVPSLLVKRFYEFGLLARAKGARNVKLAGVCNCCGRSWEPRPAAYKAEVSRGS